MKVWSSEERAKAEIEHSWDTTPTVVMADIDTGIAPLVAAMNVLGWRTHYSCSGHPWSEIDTRAHVGVWWREKTRLPDSSRTLRAEELQRGIDRLRSFLVRVLGSSSYETWELKDAPPEIWLQQNLIETLASAFLAERFQPE